MGRAGLEVTPVRYPSVVVLSDADRYRVRVRRCKDLRSSQLLGAG